jgi:hypothetical protein
MLFDNRVKNKVEYSTGSVVLDYSFSTKKDDKFTVRTRLTATRLAIIFRVSYPNRLDAVLDI